MSAKTSEKIAFFILRICALVVVAPIVMIIAFILYKGLPAINLTFLTAAPAVGLKGGGIFPAIVGTVFLVSIAIAIALPLGVICAVYMNEFVSESWYTRVIRLCILNLAGVPSVVFGLFGLGLFVIFMKLGTSVIAGSLTLAFLILPVIITSSEEALRAVPKSFREASLALGATRMRTVVSITIPSALPGILTGAILGVSRAAGETAPILFTVAAFFLPRLPKSIFDQAMALPYHLYVISTQVPGVPDEVKYGTALVLITLTFGLSLIAVVFRNRIRRKRNW